MKTLRDFLCEALTGYEAILQSVRTDGLSREQMVSILMQNDSQTLRKISDVLKQKHREDYFPFEPSQDDFLKDKEKVCGQLADAVVKLEKK